MEKLYSKEVIDAKFDAVHARFTDQDKKLDTIVEQVKTTNGSVADIKSWQAFMKGGLAVLSVIVVPIVIYIINQLLK